MQQFVQNPRLKLHLNGEVELEEPLTEIAFFGIPGLEYEITVEAGFRSDGATIPRIAWFFVGHPLDGLLCRPALAHDKFCRLARTYHERVVGDAIFFELMARYGVAAWRRTVIYLAVRCYGRYVWWWKAGKK